MDGIGRTMIITSTTNMMTPWYINIANSVSEEKYCPSRVVLSQNACTGLHCRASANVPDTQNAARNTIIAMPVICTNICGKIRMMDMARLGLTAPATVR